MKECCKKYLDEQFGGDADIMSEIYSEYAESARTKAAEAAAALAAGDWTQLDRVAHTLKGNALAAGDSEMAETAIELRKTAALHDTDASASLVAKLESFAKEL